MIGASLHQSICKPKKNIDAIHVGHASCKKIFKSIKIQNNYIPGVLTELQYSYYWYLFWVISPPSLTWRTQSRVQLELLLSEHRHSLCSRSQGWREAPWELFLPTGRNTSQRMNLSVHVCLADEPSPLSSYHGCSSVMWPCSPHRHVLCWTELLITPGMKKNYFMVKILSNSVMGHVFLGHNRL